jgi:anion-transporting  ArsA/GET3 family ATPase
VTGARAATSREAAASLDSLLASREIVVVCGPGGVGKTTCAAAVAAMAAVHHGGKVLVLTVDPARRLADALGIEEVGNEERRIPDELLRKAGASAAGELWAAMLDTKASWDALVARHAPDAATRDRILANPLYQNVAGRFVQSHDYIAMERLFELHSSGAYDLIVVDTPPTRNAVDFIEAPDRMAEFFQSRLLRWLVAPYRSRLVSMASRPFYQVADRILGTQFLEDIAEFFVSLQAMYRGFVERATAVKRLLADRRTTFVVVSTLEVVPLREAERFAATLKARQLHLGAFVLNRVLPASLRDARARAVASRLRDDAAELAERLAAVLEGLDVALAERVLHEVGRSFLDFRVVAQRQAEQQAELAGTPEVLVAVPQLDQDIADLAGLLRLGEQLWT